MHKTTLLVLAALLPLSAAAQERPNILLIVADDMGYTDVGAYGGEINTPNIDALADEGILFTQFHTAPVCAVTRAMLLSGNNNHVAGMGDQYGFHDVRKDLPGYEGHLSERIAPLPQLLSDAGYHTYSAGKWHLGTSEEHSPRAAGFERHFNMTQGAASHYGTTGFHEGGSLYREDGEDAQFPEGAYAPEYYTDRLIEYIDSNRGDDQPFFVYAAYTSPHWPLQVPDSYLDLYAGRYDEGYDVLRERRFEAAKRAGVISADHELPPRNPTLVPWNDLNADEKRVDAREMELYASLLHHFDDQIGRLIDYLKGAELYDNTLIVFMSDNGAAADDFYNRGSYSEYLQAHYDNSYENMGKPGSFVSYGLGWAEAGSAPFSRHKGFTRQGGIAASMIIAGRNVDRSGVINDSYLTVMDLAPTFLELAGVKYPTGGRIRPMLGESMVDLLAGNTHAAHDDDYATVLYYEGRAFVRQDDWKLVNLNAPFDDSTFELYNLADDPGETTNLRDTEPERFAAMVRLWHAKRQELGILLPEDQ
ncbi:MAG: sulfatase-like hydrolase/transferase [Gammaproteobacteria bacterium]|nr:sulfatase-like hydrolase/transferase [Gammaproteobacteria bacterium]